MPIIGGAARPAREAAERFNEMKKDTASSVREVKRLLDAFQKIQKEGEGAPLSATATEPFETPSVTAAPETGTESETTTSEAK
jgi:hypothetical protein